MNPNKSEIIIFIDNSGSMRSIQEDMEGALKCFVDEQKKDNNGQCFVTLITFSNSYFKDEAGYKIHYTAKHISKISDIKISPYGCTALYDSLVKAIDDTGKRFNDMIEADKPANIMFMIITDGLENDSKRYQVSDVKERIEHQSNIYSWNFRYLGANQNAILVGKNIGISEVHSATYETNKKGLETLGKVFSADASNMRAGVTRSHSLQMDYDTKKKDK